MPFVVASGLALLALGNLMMAVRGQLPPREGADPKAILLILGGLAALIALIGLGGGFIPATAILFATTSAAFGRRAFLTDLAIGAVLGVVVFLLLDKLLTLSLPAGPLERLL
jgi:putative tricarboxylic transport membrane protein